MPVCLQNQKIQATQRQHKRGLSPQLHPRRGVIRPLCGVQNFAKAPTSEKTVAVPSIASADFKAELLAALREEMVGIFKTELETALTNNFTQIKSELQSVKTELKADMAAIWSEVEVLKVTVNDMEGPLSTCTDDVVSLIK